MRRILWLAVLFLPSFNVSAQSNPPAKGNYELAARFSPKRVARMVFSTQVDPHWLRRSDRFWYSYETTEGKQWMLVDPAKGTRQPLFDNAWMAARITEIVRDPFDAQHLPIDSLRFNQTEEAIQFQVKSSETVEKKDSSGKAAKGAPEKKTYYFEYHLGSGLLTRLPASPRALRKPDWASISPDSNKIVFVKDYNLWWMDRANYEKALRKEDDSSIVEHQLTTDGAENFSYQTEIPLSGRGVNNVDEEKNRHKRKRAYIYWSPDSKAFALIRSDNRRVRDLWVIDNTHLPRPALETYKYWMPGEKETPTEELVVYNWVSGKKTVVPTARFKDQDLSIVDAPALKKDRDLDERPTMWLGTRDRFYVFRSSRDLKKIDFCSVSLSADTLQVLVEEHMNTYVETRQPRLVRQGEEFIFWSERDGWAHFYLYDTNGQLKNRITSGPYHCEDILGVDEANRVLYFSASGREPGEDPYYQHSYRVNFDGSGLKLLDPGAENHLADMSDDARYLVNNFSRVNTVPQSVLCDNTGKQLMPLEKADLSRLFAAGYHFPEPFTVKADDGITDLYGVMYKPFNFDSTRRYPLIEYVYPGPQTEAVNKSFSKSMDRTDRLAQFGFIVITVGNRGGSPSRSKWYHNYGYGNLRDYGLADKKTAAEQLAARYSFIDQSRVGICGHSGGGFMSTAAMLVYPDFFKVAVSSSGNHENNIYNRWWSEKHNGVEEKISAKGDTSFLYEIEKNSSLAAHLKGHLLLTTGDEDNNVNPANTIRLANALIKANKRFDFLLLPGQRHGYGDMTEYFFWRMGDYFCKWLLGDGDKPVNMVEMDNDIPQTDSK